MRWQGFLVFCMTASLDFWRERSGTRCDWDTSQLGQFVLRRQDNLSSITGAFFSHQSCGWTLVELNSMLFFTVRAHSGQGLLSAGRLFPEKKVHFWRLWWVRMGFHELSQCFSLSILSEVHEIIVFFFNIVFISSTIICLHSVYPTMLACSLSCEWRRHWSLRAIGTEGDVVQYNVCVTDLIFVLIWKKIIACIEIAGTPWLAIECHLCVTQVCHGAGIA